MTRWRGKVSASYSMLSTGRVIMIYGVLDMSRLSCHRFRANEVRLLLGVIAYNLGNLLRRLVLPVAIQSWSLTSLQQRLFKTGAPLVRHARYLTLQLAESYLTGSLFSADSSSDVYFADRWLVHFLVHSDVLYRAPGTQEADAQKELPQCAYCVLQARI